MEMEGAAGRILGMDILRDLINIVHHLHGIFEGKGIHSLHHIGFQPQLLRIFGVRSFKGNLIGFIHIANLDLLAKPVFSGNAKVTANFDQLSV